MDGILCHYKGIVFSGAPGSGKGTQCEKLVSRFGYCHISTGELLREALKNSTPEGIEANEYMKRGELVPDEIVIGIVKKTMEDPLIQKKGWILDGFPRTAAQAKALEDAGCTPDKIVSLQVPDDLLYERICGRRMDSVTGAIYHIKYKPAPPEVQGRLIQRKDDTPESLKTRLAMYHQNIKDVIDFYKGKVQVVEIDGNRTPDEVFNDIYKALVRPAL